MNNTLFSVPNHLRVYIAILHIIRISLYRPKNSYETIFFYFLKYTRSTVKNFQYCIQTFKKLFKASYHSTVDFQNVLKINLRVGDIGIYSMAVLAYFSCGISVFSLKNCGIKILEILRYFHFWTQKLRL